MQVRKIFTALQGMAIVGMLILTAACSGGGGSNGSGNAGTTAPADAVTVALVGVPADVNVSDTVPVTAQVQGATNMAVTWTVDGVPNGNSEVGTISGSGNAVTYTAPTTEGSYVLAATSVMDTTKSAKTQVHVRKATNTATVTLSPAGATISTGATQAYYAAVSGSESQTITWFVDNVSNGNATVGALTPNGDGAHMLYTAPAAGGTHTIKAVATNASNASVSGSTTVTVQGTLAPSVPPAITTQPLSIAVNAGQTATFSVVATGTATLSYQWSKNGTAISGATSASYTTPATSTADSGAAFTVVVTNAAGSVTSSAATLTVNAVNGVQTGWAGFGYATTGGAGQQVVHVTNLNDSGPGSFRAAAGSNRTIVFDVAGTLPVSSPINFSSCSNVTVDGTSAPAPGITFTGYQMVFSSCNNIIVKGIRNRCGIAGSNGEGIQFQPDNYNVVIDHCSFSNYGDEGIDIWHGNHDFTIQNCIIGAGMPGSPNYPCLIGGGNYNITFYHNLISNGYYRIPAIGWDDANGTAAPGICAEVINNVGWKYSSNYGIEIYWGAKANVLGNYMYNAVNPGNTAAVHVDTSSGAPAQCYSNGNFSKDGSSIGNNMSSPFSVPSAARITATSALDGANYVKANAGCRVGGLDAYDQALINDLSF
ncbi:MAG TPA: hypothetical protein VJ528_06695 [Geothrix sp.]|nr:hypothetical protein [Geothrix sp.]